MFDDEKNKIIDDYRLSPQVKHDQRAETVLNCMGTLSGEATLSCPFLPSHWGSKLIENSFLLLKQILSFNTFTAICDFCRIYPMLPC